MREPDLVTPSRSLVHASEVLVQKIASSKVGSLGAKLPHRLWLCSDVLLLGKPREKARTPYPNPYPYPYPYPYTYTYS